VCRKLAYFAFFVFMPVIGGVSHAGLFEPPIENPSFESPDMCPGGTGQWDYYADDWILNSQGMAYLEDGSWEITAPNGCNTFKLWSGAYLWQQIGTWDQNTDYVISMWVGRGYSSSALQVELWAGGNPSLFPTTHYGEIEATVGATLIGGAGLTPKVTVGESEWMTLILNTGTGFSSGDALWIRIECISPDGTATWVDNVEVFARVDPALASDPNPVNEKKDVLRDVVLGWRPGIHADKHDVYFGTVFDDVSSADRTNPLGVLVRQGQDVNDYSPDGLLEFDRRYYWRIDEVNGPPDNTIFTGEVWSFTVELFAYPILGENITVIASSCEEGKEPENTINGSGLDEEGLLHDKGDENLWLSGRDGAQPTWIEFEFDKVYKLHEMWVWNYNEGLEPVIGLGLKGVSIEYSLNGTDYMTLGVTHEFAQAPGGNGYAHNTTIEFNGVAAKFVRLTANSNWGGLLAQYGLSEVRFFQIPVHAKEPAPDSGATNVTLEPILVWRAGREAAEHNVYFSDEQQAVIEGTSDVATVVENSFGPLDLDLGKTYYWRVDEVNNAETPDTWQGEVWDFTTREYFVVDDFEDYNDYPPDRIFDEWIDGYGIATNGSTVGYSEPDFSAGEHFVEINIVHSGSQSMPYFYDNSVGNSEAIMTLSSRHNWTEKGISNLSLWYRGNPEAFVEAPEGTYTINASGADIWDTADEFRFIYKRLSGPGSVIARVEGVEDTDPWAKAGVMIRQSLEPGSKFAAVYITPGNGCRFQGRLIIAGDATADDSVATAEQMAITAPCWVKIERDDADNFNGYYSSDGVNWVAMAWNPQNTGMSTDVYIGLAVTSHNSNAACTAVFSNVQTSGTVSPQAWTQQAVGVDMPSNKAARMYVVLNNSAVVYNDNPDASQTDEWTQWNIDLQGFADLGVNLTDVDTLGIGFGDRSNPQPGGSGLVYFDDIRLYPPLPGP
jgi:hypothetical protein